MGSSLEDVTVLSSRQVQASEFNSEDAFCDDLTDGEGPSEIEILGMELVLWDNEMMLDHAIDDGESDSRNDPEKHNHKQAIAEDSPDFFWFRLPRGGSRRHRNLYLAGEVDSLLLTEERLPHLVHRTSTSPVFRPRLNRYYDEGLGLFGEVDSLTLDKRRLPHIVQKRGNTIKCAAAVPTEESTSTEEVIDFFVSTNFDDRDAATSTTEQTASTSGCSSEKDDNDDDSSITTCETVDSLILTRRRLAAAHSLAHNGTHSNGMRWTNTWTASRSREPHRKVPPNAGVGLGPDFKRTSSGACAA